LPCNLNRSHTAHPCGSTTSAWTHVRGILGIPQESDSGAVGITLHLLVPARPGWVSQASRMKHSNSVAPCSTPPECADQPRQPHDPIRDAHHEDDQDQADRWLRVRSEHCPDSPGATSSVLSTSSAIPIGFVWLQLRWQGVC
jgi:hypothetical protein